mgnify:FL=1
MYRGLHMDNRSLVLLGLLMGQSQHGYQINEFIENNLSMITDMKKPTAYATLDKLSKLGYIDVHLEQEGNRPPRKVYSINEKGTHYFYSLLHENLSKAEMFQYQGDLGLMFMDYLPNEKSHEALHERLKQTEKLLQTLNQTPHHSNVKAVNLAIKHKIKMLTAEVKFIQETIDEMNKSHF